jgi:hypothetical protein
MMKALKYDNIWDTMDTIKREQRKENIWTISEYTESIKITLATQAQAVIARNTTARLQHIHYSNTNIKT